MKKIYKVGSNYIDITKVYQMSEPQTAIYYGNLTGEINFNVIMLKKQSSEINKFDTKYLVEQEINSEQNNPTKEYLEMLEAFKGEQ